MRATRQSLRLTMKESIGKVSAVKWNASLSEHAVCLSSEGELSIEMAKILKKMPGAEMGVPDASVVLEINMNHPIAKKLEALYESDRDTLAKYAKILYCEACLIGGITLDDPKEFTELVSGLMV